MGLQSFQCLLPKAACLPTFTSPTTTTPVSNSCTCSGLQSGHWADQRGGIRRQQGPLLPQGGEGYLQEQVRALQREDLLYPKRGDLRARDVQELHGVIETNIERVCFNVNELVCNLVEAVHYET